MTIDTEDTTNIKDFFTQSLTLTRMCTPGFSSDNILRLPAFIGPFVEASGTDCYRNDSAVMGLAWFTIIVAVILASIISIELAQRRLPTASLRFGLLGQLMSLLTTVIFCLFAVYYPEGCFSTWVVFCFWLWFWAISYMKLLLDGGVMVVTKVTKRNYIDVLGGPMVVAFIVVVVTSCFTAVMIGTIGTAVYAWNQRDIPKAMIFWSLHCVGFTCFVTSAIIYAYYLMGRFANLVESVAANAKGIQRSGGDSDKGAGSGSPNPTATQRVDDLVHRFRDGRKTIFLSLPMGAGAWLVHSFVLPVFYYLVFMHLLNNVTGVLALWYIYTPVTRKWALITFLSCGLVNRNKSPTAVGSGTAGDSAVVSAEGRNSKVMVASGNEPA